MTAEEMEMREQTRELIDGKMEELIEEIDIDDIRERLKVCMGRYIEC